MIAVDKDGNPLETEPTPELPEPDKTVEAIEDLNNSINNQTEAIKEQTEVSKNIFQQIIELPRQVSWSSP